MSARPEELELMKTIEARIDADADLARTLVRSPRASIHRDRPISSGGLHALEALRALSSDAGGRLALHETLGEGGMGIVHLATQATLGRFVAVKTLRAEAGDLDATLRILREAWVTGALEHPNVVPVYDVALDASGSPVIVMKRIEGRPWSELIHDAELVKARYGAKDLLDWNVDILASVCNAVHFAHSRGILHRDLKPENVMIGAFGEVYVLDWGIAVSLVDDPSGRLPQVAQATEIAGTPAYMAPEMMLGDPKALGQHTDVFLLGAMFYEIFSGAPPHRGDTVHAIVASVMLSNPDFAPGFPAEARKICERAMHKDPRARFASAEEVKRAIEEYLRHRGSRKLARDAKQSLLRLLEVIEKEAPSEERALAIFNLLGECRFGYRAALGAWAENEAARQGLDRALMAVIDYELAEGDPRSAATLLREVTTPPAELPLRVERAVKERADEEERRRKLEADHDARVGRRTRTTIGSIFGAIWTLVPLIAWIHRWTAGATSHLVIVGSTFFCLLLGVSLFVWARETMTKTLVNRRLARTLGLQFTLQLVLATGAWLAGLSPATSQILHIFSWSVTQALLSVWIEPWFGLAAAVNAVSFLVACWAPSLLYPLMALDNAVFTFVLVRVWLPREDIEWLRAVNTPGTSLRSALAARIAEEREARERRRRAGA